MSSSAAKVIAIVAVILTFLLALIGYKVSRQYAENAAPAAPVVAEGTAAQQAPKTLAVVALKPLLAYQEITKDDIALVEVAVAPTGYYSSVDDVIGKQPIVDIDGAAPVTRRYFGEANLLARAIPAGHQAISVEISDVIAVGGFVKPGDTVDVLLNLRGSGEEVKPQARVLLKKVRVLAYEESLVERPEGLQEEDTAGTDAEGKKTTRSSNSSSNTRRSRTAVLAVPEAETTRLMLGASQGELRLALYGSTPPGTEATPVPDTVVAGGLPVNSKALADAEANKVPDKAVSLEQLARIKAPPAKQSAAPFTVPVYRAADVQTVSVKP